MAIHMAKTYKTVNMRGEWNQEKWDSAPLNTVIRFDGENYYKMLNGHVAHIETEYNAGSAYIYHDWENSDGYDEIILFDTVKIVPEARGFQGESRDKHWTPMKRHDKRGHTVKTTLGDIIAYLNGSYVGETKVETKNHKTHVTFYRED